MKEKVHFQLQESDRIFFSLSSFDFVFIGSFEIVINEQLIFSKLETGGFPYEDDVSKHMSFKG